MSVLLSEICGISIINWVRPSILHKKLGLMKNFFSQLLVFMLHNKKQEFVDT